MKLWPILFALLAQDPNQDPALIEHTKIVKVEADPANVKPGQEFTLTFTVRVDPEWHIYSTTDKGSPTAWKFDPPVEPAGEPVEPKPKVHRTDLGGGKVHENLIHEGEVRFKVPVRLARNAPSGPLKIKGVMSGMECDPNGCIGFDYKFEGEITVEGGVTTPPPPESHTTIKEVKAEPATGKAGEKIQLTFKVAIEKDWHIYGVKDKDNPTRWEFDAGAPVELAGTATEPALKHKKTPLGKDDEGKDEFLEEWYHEGEVTFRVPVTIKPGTRPGPAKITGRMVGQECSNVCIELDVPFEAGFTVAEGVAAAAPVEDQDASSEASKEFEARGFGWLLGIAVLGGLISLVMPCVYPLIPITITFFAKQAGASRSQGLLLSFSYAAGIIITFTGLGFLLTIILGAQGAQIFASDPWVNLVIAAVFMAFALSLLGLFEFKLPAFLTNLAGGSGPRTGIGGAFTLGLLFSVITFTCTIPFAGVILAVAASADHKAAGLAAMFVYSFVMAVPFIFLGLFPSMVKELPKSGGWLHTMKIAAGLFEVALAAAYIWKADRIWGWGLFDRPVVLAIWIAVSFILALYLLGTFRVKGDSDTPGVGIGRILSGLAFGTIGFYLVGGMLGRPLGVFGIVLPPETRAVSAAGAAKQDVYEHLDEAEKRAKAEGKPVFVEFTGIT